MPIDVKNQQPWSRLMIAKTKFLLLQKILKYFMHAKFNILNDQHTHSNLAIKIKNTINNNRSRHGRTQLKCARTYQLFLQVGL